jgi:hypothetical protein
VSALNIRPAGEAFVRPGGRDGDWWPDPQDDDSVVSPYAFVAVPGSEAEATFALLRQTVAGKVPLLVGSAHDFGLLIEQIEDSEPDVAEILAALPSFDLEQWFAERVAEVQVWQNDLGSVMPPRGPWPRTVKSVTTFATLHDEITDTPHETVYIALLPAAHAYELPAHVIAGGWGDSPETIVHVALAADWEARYGAVVSATARGVIEFQVARPPTTRDAAERLALEHFHYNREAVPGTLQATAAALVTASVWRFAWD